MNRPRILLADDHTLVLERVAALLQSTFDVVGAARTGREMISEAIRLNPDVIVADISMPGLSGIEAAHQLHERGSMAKLVFLTIHSNDEFVNACLAEGALGYVVGLRGKVSREERFDSSHQRCPVWPVLHFLREAAERLGISLVVPRSQAHYKGSDWDKSKRKWM